MADAPALKETPAQEAMRLEQARVRLEQGRAAAVRANVKEPAAEFSEPFIFRFKMFKNTGFSGLWRLEVLNKFGKVEEMICDADTLPNTLEAIGNIFVNKGY